MNTFRASAFSAIIVSIILISYIIFAPLDIDAPPSAKGGKTTGHFDSKAFKEEVQRTIKEQTQSESNTLVLKEGSIDSFQYKPQQLKLEDLFPKLKDPRHIDPRNIYHIEFKQDLSNTIAGHIADYKDLSSLLTVKITAILVHLMI
jgi:hypothetical protein